MKLAVQHDRDVLSHIRGGGRSRRKRRNGKKKDEEKQTMREDEGEEQEQEQEGRNTRRCDVIWLTSQRDLEPVCEVYGPQSRALCTGLSF